MQIIVDTGISEWGNPAGRRPATMQMGQTRGTETSKYP